MPEAIYISPNAQMLPTGRTYVAPDARAVRSWPYRPGQQPLPDAQSFASQGLVMKGPRAAQNADRIMEKVRQYLQDDEAWGMPPGAREAQAALAWVRAKYPKIFGTTREIARRAGHAETDPRIVSRPDAVYSSKSAHGYFIPPQPGYSVDTQVIYDKFRRGLPDTIGTATHEPTHALDYLRKHKGIMDALNKDLPDTMRALGAFEAERRARKAAETGKNAYERFWRLRGELRPAEELMDMERLPQLTGVAGAGR